MSAENADRDVKESADTEKNDMLVIEDDAFRRDQDEGVSEAYLLKCELVNQCIQTEIGFGRYQWELFILTGLGWMADNIWLQGVAIILPQVEQELNPSRVEYATLALYVGLILGATTWGMLADVIGRKLSWNITLFIAGVFGIAAGASPNFVTLASLIAVLGFGVGGNLPVDGALFLEHIPKSHQWLLTLLSAWWSFGQLVASLIAWAFIANFSCASTVPNGQCPKSENMGWRYTFYTLGALTFVMFLLRFVVFNLQESSKYLLAKGRDEDAIEVLQYLAKRNGRTISLTAEQLRSVAGGQSGSETRMTNMEIIKHSFDSFSLAHVKPLFSTRRLAVNTSITIILWGLIGLAYPLFNAFLPLYLEARVPAGSNAVSVTYRNYSIISILGVPGSIIACVLVDWTRGGGYFAIGGRKFAMAISTCLTGIFLFLFTTSTNQAGVLGYSCASGLTQNAMYGVLYAYTPEVFPAPHRGTGDALASAFNRVTGLLAPIIKIATTPASGGTSSVGANGPIFVSASLFIAASVLMMLLPIETAGKAAL